MQFNCKPFIYIVIYINDLFKIELEGSSQLYADDSSLTYSSDNLDSMIRMIIEDPKLISDIDSKVIY